MKHYEVKMLSEKDLDMKQAKYIGGNFDLFNKEATITYELKGRVLAQFNDVSLGTKLTLRWNEFNMNEFEELRNG